jgi:hypothetical protein
MAAAAHHSRITCHLRIDPSPTTAAAPAAGTVPTSDSAGRGARTSMLSDSQPQHDQAPEPAAPGRLDMRIETVALVPWYDPPFTDLHGARARRGLIDVASDVDGFLARQQRRPTGGEQRAVRSAIAVVVEP